MEVESASVAIGIVIGGFGLLLGYARRYQSHQLSIRGDLLFILILIMEFFTLAAAGTDTIFALLAIFDLFYIFGYRMANPRDWIGISTYSEDLLESYDRPLVYYVKDGVMYTSGQNLKSAVRDVFGIRDTLKADLTSIRRTRLSRFSKKGRRGKKLTVAAVAKYDITPVQRNLVKIGKKKVLDELGNKVRIPRYLSFPASHHEITFADCVETDPITYDTTVEVREGLIQLYIKEQNEKRRLLVENRGLRYDDASELVQGIFDLDLDSQNIEVETLQQLAGEMQRRRNISATAAKLSLMNFDTKEVTKDAGHDSEEGSAGLP